MDDHVFAASAVTVAAFAIAAPLTPKVPPKLEIVKRDKMGIGFEHHVAALAAIAAGRPASGDKLLAAEGDATVSAIAPLANNLDVVNEDHDRERLPLRLLIRSEQGELDYPTHDSEQA
jgi:hypothetical protein